MNGRQAHRGNSSLASCSFRESLLPRGVLEVYMTGGPTYFFGLKINTLGIFLG